jgi:hypothetical protein
MEVSVTNQLIKFLCVLLLATNVVAGGGDSDSGPVETLDKVVIADPCTDDGDTDTVIYTSLILSSDSGFVGDEIISAESGSQAIVVSYDAETHILVYYQTAETGIGHFIEGELITGSLSGVGTVEEIIVDAATPCAERIVSLDVEPLEMTLEVPKTGLEKVVGAVTEFVEMSFDLMYENCEDTFESDDVWVSNTCALILTGMLIL